MGQIHRLTEELKAKIAAGEVIENPASVVKELIENSLDASASKIVLRVEEAGLSLISVLDDGEGMEPEDMPLAFDRYSTSKIHRESDLLKIRTLGFRGEALASICAVSKVRLISSTGKGSFAVECQGGEIGPAREFPHPRGTTVEVRDLFYNFPVRRKFLSSPSSLLREITRVFTTYSLGYPEVHFVFIRDGREVRNYPPSSLGERIAQVMGREFLKGLREISGEYGQLRIYGYSSAPGKGRPRPNQFFFLNKRPVYNKEFYGALKAAYSGLIQSPNQPEAVIFLEAPEDSFDVNIHPSKREVKFREPGAIFSLFRVAVKGKEKEGVLKTSPGVVSDFSSPEYSSVVSHDLFVASPREKDYRIVGQVRGLFIVVEREDGLYLVDQHNAMERAIYERLKKGDVPSQPLLIPSVVDLSQEDMILLREKSEELKSAGFSYEELSGDTVVLRAHPSIVSAEKVEEVFLDALRGKEPVLATIACRASVKRGEILSMERMERIVEDLFSLENYQVCPHGRPIVIKFSWEELARKIGRNKL